MPRHRRGCRDRYTPADFVNVKPKKSDLDELIAQQKLPHLVIIEAGEVKVPDGTVIAESKNPRSRGSRGRPGRK